MLDGPFPKGGVIGIYSAIMYCMMMVTGFSLDQDESKEFLERAPVEVSNAIVLWGIVAIVFVVVAATILVLDARKYRENEREREHQLNMKNIELMEKDEESTVNELRRRVAELEHQTASVKHVAALREDNNRRGITEYRGGDLQ